MVSNNETHRSFVCSLLIDIGMIKGFRIDLITSPVMNLLGELLGTNIAIHWSTPTAGKHLPQAYPHREVFRTWL